MPRFASVIRAGPKTASHQFVPALPGMIREFGKEYELSSTLPVWLTPSFGQMYRGTDGLFGSP